jgi:predicted PhzF superfamily epimerase YddE/YHI9
LNGPHKNVVPSELANDGPGGYLAAEGLLANNELAIEQGSKMGLRSILRIRVDQQPELSGTGIVVPGGMHRL